jgi:hypothetical protein
MKRKFFFPRLFAAVFLILVVVLYFFFYFIPSLEAINRYKRQVKDMNLKIADFKKAATSFSFPGQRERGYFLRLERELAGKIPEAASREDFTRLFGEISGYIRKLAERDGIDNLVIEPGSPGLKHAGLLNTAAPRLSGMVKGPQRDSDLSTLVKGVQYHMAAVIFTGELKNALNFINHLSWSYYLVEDKILVCTGDKFPCYIVFLKIYSTAGDGGTTVSPPQEKGRQGLIVDIHSGMLLRPIPAYFLKNYPKKEIPQQFAKKRR